MAIKLYNDFLVTAAPDETYALLVDVERVAPCIPGAQMTGPAADGGHDAEMTMRVGPMKLAFNGTVVVAERDDAARRATMVAEGKERRGQGNARATMQMEVTSHDDGRSRVAIETEVQVAGRLAQIGGSVMGDVAARMILEMSKGVEAMLQSPLSPAADSRAERTDDGESKGGLATEADSHATHTVPRSPQAPAVRARPPSAGSLLVHILIARMRALGRVLRGWTQKRLRRSG